MVTVISRPLGHKLTDQELNATVYNSSQEALFLTEFAHGLQTGDYVYIQSRISAYNGFKYVDSIAYNEFKVKESEDGAYVAFKQSVEATYRISVLPHGYLAIAQPIVYELESDLFPVPSSEQYYNTRVVSSVEDAQGYTQLNLSEALENPQELDFIQLVGDGSLAGAYQILTVLQPWSVIINLAYSALNVFTGYEVLKYYNNYCINVEIWAGLDEDHPWVDEKPYENLATLKLRPDDDGRVKFSISDILRGHIHTRNKLDLDTLPNNLDFWTGFYIRYFESYDSSDGEEVTTFEGSEFSDQISFEGHAINADMPFKSVYQSHMSEYLNEDTYYAKWLALQSNPVVIIGYFFDLSFINSLANRDLIVYKNGVPETITDPGVGVIRIPIEPEEAGTLCVAVWSDTSEQQVPPEPLNLSLLLNGPVGPTTWTLGEAPTVNIVGAFGTTLLYYDRATANGATLKVNYNVTVTTGGATSIALFFTITNSTSAVQDFQSVPVASDGVVSGSVSIVATTDRIYFGIYASNGGDPVDITINSISFGDASTVTVPGEQITEEICMTVLEECDDTLVPDDARLLEDGEYRLLE